MIIYYVRHGDPIYDPDSLTPEGHRQAAALAERLKSCGIDRVYTSTSNRAILTASYTCQAIGKEPVRLDFANESHAWREMTYDTEEGRRWFFNHPTTRALTVDPTVRALGHEWHTHPLFKDYNYKAGIDRVRTELDGLLASLGYLHDYPNARYRITEPCDERIAIFAHAGFGSLFFSCLFDIPYPEYCARYDICTTGVSVIDFRPAGEWAIPVLATHSNDAHLYHAGMNTRFHGGKLI